MNLLLYMAGTGGVVGYLVWRGSRSIGRAVFAGLFFPPFGLLLAALVVKKGTVEGWLPDIGPVGFLTLGAVMLTVALVWHWLANRERNGNGRTRDR